MRVLFPLFHLLCHLIFYGYIHPNFILMARLFKLVSGTTGTTETPVATTDKVKLGETLLLKANIKGNINVETAFKYCKVSFQRGVKE